MVGLVVLVAVLSFLDFDALWTRFHQIAFRNDLWLLDPTRDYLIMLGDKELGSQQVRLETGDAEPRRERGRSGLASEVTRSATGT